MITLPVDTASPGTAAGLTVGELALLSGMSADELIELVEYGALAPLNASQTKHRFAAAWIAPLRAACVLQRTYDLELFTVVLLLDQLQRIETLENQVRTISARRC